MAMGAYLQGLWMCAVAELSIGLSAQGIAERIMKMSCEPYLNACIGSYLVLSVLSQMSDATSP